MIAAGLAVAAVCAVVLIVAYVVHERVRTGGAGATPRVVAFELAGTGRAAHDLLADVGSDGRSRLRRAIGIDRWIIAGYAIGLVTMSLLSIWVVRKVSDGVVEGLGTSVAVVMAAASLAAGLLDLVENAKLIEILDAWSEPDVGPEVKGEALADVRQAHRRSQIATFDRPSLIARRAATVKFALVGIVIVGWGATIATIALTHKLR